VKKPKPRRKPAPGAGVDVFENGKGEVRLSIDFDAYSARQERAFKRGDVLALFQAVLWFGNAGLPWPDWLRVAFAKGYFRAHNGEAMTLDEAFGKLHPKHRQRSRVKEDAEKMLPIYCAIENGRQAGRALDGVDGLFASVGREFAVSPERCRDLYYRAVKEVTR
jgi:hypothetical protein